MVRLPSIRFHSSFLAGSGVLFVNALLHACPALMFSVAASANDSSQCWKTLTRIPTILHTRNKPAGSRARMSTQPVSGERGRIGVQERLDVCDGLRVVPELDGVDAEGAGGGDVRLHIIQEDHLLRLHAQALAGQREDAWVWLGDPFFVRIDDEFSHLR